MGGPFISADMTRKDFEELKTRTSSLHVSAAHEEPEVAWARIGQLEKEAAELAVAAEFDPLEPDPGPQLGADAQVSNSASQQRGNQPTSPEAHAQAAAPPDLGGIRPGPVNEHVYGAMLPGVLPSQAEMERLHSLQGAASVGSGEASSQLSRAGSAAGLPSLRLRVDAPASSVPGSEWRSTDASPVRGREDAGRPDIDWQVH